jgi:hypothetical protein
VILDNSNLQQLLYLARHIAEMDAIIKLECPFSEITRSPRSLLQRQYWKESEWRAFLLFYALAVFSKVLTAKYYCHLLLLVCGTLMLLNPDCSDTSIQQGKRCFLNVVQSSPSAAHSMGL